MSQKQIGNGRCRWQRCIYGDADGTTTYLIFIQAGSDRLGDYPFYSVPFWDC
jgi:hypothetical protein